MERLSRLCFLLLLPAAFALAGCPNSDPWAGLTRTEFDQLEEHRLAGLAILENGGAEVLPGGNQRLAVEEFRQLVRKRPRLAMPHLNLALALARTANAGDAVPEAREGVRLAPKSALAHRILASVMDRSQPELALAEAEESAKLAPDSLRAYGFLLEQLRNLPGARSQREEEVIRKLAQLAPENLQVIFEVQRLEADKGNWDAVLEGLERIHSRIPRFSDDCLETEKRIRAAIDRNKAAEVKSGVNILANLIKADNAESRSERAIGSGLFSHDYAALFGSKDNAADMAMVDWDVPPPTLPSPSAPPTVTWSDVTASVKLDGARVRGIAPASIGDLDFRSDAGNLSDGDYLRLLDRAEIVTGGTPLATWVNGEASFAPVAPAPEVAPASPLLADLNNDYSLDLLAIRDDGDRLWRNRGSMRSAEGGEESQKVVPGSPGMSAAATLPTRGPGTATVADLDIDGDLDILRLHTRSGGLGLTYLRNNGNLTFTDRTGATGLTFPAARARQALCADFDSDGDPDIFVIRAGGNCLLFSNLRQDRFRDDTGERLPKCRKGGRAAVAGDWDRDGDWDLAVAGVAPHGVRLLRNQGGKFTDEPLFAGDGALQAEWIETLDFDNDTWPDLATAGINGVQLWRNDRGTLRPSTAASPTPCAWVTAFDYDRDRDPDLLATTADGSLLLLRNDGGSAMPGYEMELHSVFNHFEGGTSSFGIGAEIAVSTHSGVQKVLATGPATLVGLGGMRMPISVRVKWPHRAPQNYFPRKQGDAIALLQTITDSCPFLYTWNGSEWRFATDFLWRSPLGMQFAPGAPIPHDQTRDWVRLTGDQLPSVDGFYHLAATEDLREISYLDWIELLAVDHPEGTEIYCDERFQLGEHPDFELHTVRTPQLPRSARDEVGRDLLPALTSVDNRYTPVPTGRYRGITAPHDFILDLGDIRDRANLKLFLNGWIFPANSSVYLAASQNPDIKIIPPTLSVGDGRGGWRVVDEAVGIPCGKRKTVILDLSGKLTPGDHRVKLTTTMELRWDAAWFASGEEAVPLRTAAVPLKQARLSERGIGRMYREAPDGPDLTWFDRVGTLESLDWPPIAGDFTRLGETAPLLTDIDDRYVIFGPGDCIRLRFDGRHLGPPPAGWKRTFVLSSDGWTKDSNPNTISGEVVAPLPYHGMKRYPYGPGDLFPNDSAHRAWQREWNTRRLGSGSLE